MEVREHRVFNGEGMTDKDHVGSVTGCDPVVPTNLINLKVYEATIDENT